MYYRKRGVFLKKMSKVRSISIGGVLTTITVIFQSAPVFLPVFGLVLSPLSTLPIAIAAYYNISLGIAVFLSSAFILALISLQETIILLFTTGLLGVVIGTFLYRKGIYVSILFSSAILSLGIIIITFILGISAFGDLTYSLSLPLILIVFLLFSIIYVSFWNVFLRKFINYLIKLKFIK